MSQVTELSKPKRRQAFTLIELMVVVVILGVLAALALPALAGYMRYSKTSEATVNLNNLFKTAAAFYSQEHSAQGTGAVPVTGCVVEPTTIIPAVPNGNKGKFVAAGGFIPLGFSVGDFVYYGYGISSIGSAGTLVCGEVENSNTVYTFYARGDLDGDGTLSTFDLAVGTDAQAQLYHARGFYVDNPIE